jgi:putative acetyltransferase
MVVERASMRIRVAVTDDAMGMHDLHTRSLRELWITHYSDEQIEAWISGRTPEGYLPAIVRGEMFVAEEDGRLLGFGHSAPGWVRAIYVAPEAAGMGIGRALLTHAVAEAGVGGSTEIRLLSTLNAAGFYSHFGFEMVEGKVVQKGNTSLPIVVMRLPVQSS